MDVYSTSNCFSGLHNYMQMDSCVVDTLKCRYCHRGGQTIDSNTFGTGLETSHVTPYYCIVTVTCALCCAWGEDEDRTVSVYL